MAYAEKDLFYKDYTDKAADSGDNPYIRGGVERDELNRKQKYEIVPFINKFGENYFKSTPTFATYRKIELMIREELPEATKKHEDIDKWLLKNWDAYGMQGDSKLVKKPTT